MPAPREYLKNPACIDALLARWNEDGLYYRVTLISCDKRSNKSLVKFEDGESYPIDNRDLHIQLNLDKVSDDKIICCLCEMGEEKEPNVIIMCDFCQLGYHVGCHQPPIGAAFVEDADREWCCETCLEIADLGQKRKRVKLIKETPKKKKTPKKKEITKKEETSKKKEITKKEETPKKKEITKKEETPKKKGITKKEESPKKKGMTKKEESPKKKGMTKKEETLKKKEITKRVEFKDDYEQVAAEEMDPKIIVAAKALAVDTKEFVAAM